MKSTPQKLIAQGTDWRFLSHARPGVFSLLVQPHSAYAVNKAVAFVPYVNMLNLVEIAVTEQHWSVRKQKDTGQE